jgi:hypothetical protein
MKAYILIWVLENFTSHRMMNAGAVRFETKAACERAGRVMATMAAEGQTQGALLSWSCEKAE